MSGERFSAKTDWGYEDVALLDIRIDNEKVSKKTKLVRARVFKALVEEYALMENISTQQAELEVDAIICCTRLEYMAKFQNVELN